MLKILFGSQIGILAIVTVVGATAVVVVSAYLFYKKSQAKGK
jgi:hypothetical protein